jgi:hypothetical protein
MLDYDTAGGDVTSGDENCNVTVSVNQNIKEKAIYIKNSKNKKLCFAKQKYKENLCSRPKELHQ